MSDEFPLLAVGVACSSGPSHEADGPSSNGDNYLIANDGVVRWRVGLTEQRSEAVGEGMLVAVSSGVGATAEITSTASVRVLAKLYGTRWPRKPARVLLRYLTASHDRLYGRAESTETLIGSSVTALWCSGSSAGWVSVGDTRLYLFRDGRLTQLTSDHTFGAFARRNSRLPGPSPDDVVQRFLQGSSGLGDDTRLHLELGLDAGEEVLEPGDCLLLCSRGVWDAVDEVSLADVLSNVPAAQAAAVLIIERAVARGSRGNVTALVVRAAS